MEQSYRRYVSGCTGKGIHGMENNFKVNMNEYLPLRDVVFNTLRQAILKGELAPGERLMEIQLAEKLGVSRTPIREAIRKLELEGLVLMIPRKGAEVAKISEKSLRDVLEVRRSLEELAIELACQRMSEEDMDELERVQGNFRNAIAKGEAMTIAETDEQYHDVIYQGTGNDKLVQMLNNQKSMPSTMPAARRIIQIAVACLKFPLKEWKKERMVESPSSRTNLSVT